MMEYETVKLSQEIVNGIQIHENLNNESVYKF